SAFGDVAARGETALLEVPGSALGFGVRAQATIESARTNRDRGRVLSLRGFMSSGHITGVAAEATECEPTRRRHQSSTALSETEAGTALSRLAARKPTWYAVRAQRTPCS